MDDAQEPIRLRAYAIWESEGRPEGRHEDHWRRAHREMHGLEDATADTQNPIHVAPAGAKAAPGRPRQ